MSRDLRIRSNCESLEGGLNILCNCRSILVHLFFGVTTCAIWGGHMFYYLHQHFGLSDVFPQRINMAVLLHLPNENLLYNLAMP